MTEQQQESDHDILLDMRADLRHLVEAQNKLETRIYGVDGNGGLCGEVQEIKGQQLRWLGRDGAIATAFGGVATLITLGLLKLGGHA